jgi:hypothetical protein
MKALSGKNWMTIGPFPGQNGTPELVKSTLGVSYPPESGLDFSAKYAGVAGKNVSWQHTDAVMTQKNFDDGVNFEVANKSAERAVFYAVTHIISPDKRDVDMCLSCDWWANVYLNGTLVRSNRPETLSQTDGAQFSGDALSAVNFHLRKGLNVLLIKVLSGASGSGFAAELNDPGDLLIQAEPN